MFVARVEKEFDRTSFSFGGKIERHGAASWVRFVPQIIPRRFNACGGIEFECSIRQLKTVTTKVGHRTTTEVVPSSPLTGMIDFIDVRTSWRGSQPKIPVESLGNRIARRGTIDTIGPTMRWMPNMNLVDRPQQARLNHFKTSSKSLGRATLISSLRREPRVAPCQLLQDTAFSNGMS